MSPDEIDELLNPYSGSVRPEKHDLDEQEQGMRTSTVAIVTKRGMTHTWSHIHCHCYPISLIQYTLRTLSSHHDNSFFISHPPFISFHQYPLLSSP